MPNELYLALVLSTKAHANIKHIDPKEALAAPGVHAFFSAKDLNAELNKHGTIIHDEEIFVSKTVILFKFIVITLFQKL